MKIPKLSRTAYIIAGYALFMLVFYFWGITGAQFDSFVAIVLLSLVYAGVVHFVTKIHDGSTKTF